MAHNDTQSDEERMRRIGRSAARMEGFKGFMEGFAPFAVAGTLGGLLVAGAVLGSIALFGGGAAAIAATGGALKLSTIVAVSCLVVSGVVGGGYYAHKRATAEKENFRRAMEDNEDRPRSRREARGRDREMEDDLDLDGDEAPRRARPSRGRESDREEERTRPKWLEEELRRGSREDRRSFEDRYYDEAPYSGRYH